MEALIPKKMTFAMEELTELSFICIPTIKKFISEKRISTLKIGRKHFIARDELVKYINSAL